MLENAGVDVVLIGEALMKVRIKAMLLRLMGENEPRLGVDKVAKIKICGLTRNRI